MLPQWHTLFPKTKELLSQLYYSLSLYFYSLSCSSVSSVFVNAVAIKRKSQIKIKIKSLSKKKQTIRVLKITIWTWIPILRLKLVKEWKTSRMKPNDDLIRNFGLDLLKNWSLISSLCIESTEQERISLPIRKFAGSG